MAGCMPRARGAQGQSPNVAWSLLWKHGELQPQRRLLTLRAMKSILRLVPLCILAACGSGKSSQTVDRDTLTERQKDSILANSKIPNARAVGRAMNSRLDERPDSQQRHGGEGYHGVL